MKNLFLLPTEKPSRLIHNVLGYGMITNEFTKSDLELIQAEYQNIYITNDELPKLDEWGLNIKNNVIFKSKGFTPDDYDKQYCKKIILTTDQDLIKYGVQAIDDEFLEWFVKNPSCEKVGVINTFDYNKKHFVEHSGYKIIIPKEEPKQETTLEEFIKKQLSLGKYQDQESAIRHSIELGAKWQQEQICNHNYNLISEQGHRVIKCSKCNHTQPI